MDPRAYPETLTPNRKILCLHYRQCLDTAIEEGWAGFTCAECTDFEHIRWSEAEAASDGFACLALLLATLSPEATTGAEPRV